MPQPERARMIREIEKMRSSSLICYLTSLRPNLPANMGDDAVRVMFDHLLSLPKRPVKNLDIFLCSNGGSGTVPWRLVSVFREFAEKFNVLIPYRAYSAATLLALGADEIVMHPFGELGPIDPTVSNEYNPVEQGTGRRLGISVEDVKAYVNFIKNGVGITHEDELIRAVEVLANKVHPLALGNVERFLAQSRMIAGKIMHTHMQGVDEHTIKEIVENLASKLYFHGHPINRREARQDLKLKVIDPANPGLEQVMWELYMDFEKEFQNRVTFDPFSDLASAYGLPEVTQQPPATEWIEYELIHAIIESVPFSERHIIKRKLRLAAPGPGQVALQDTILSQGWIRSPAPQEESRSPQSGTSAGDAPLGQLAPA
ncbi:MAG: hypothetical protein M0Z50_18395 [Planctomycetia bacterium]|nr:hypothetical protein [Planctomycetia bacterium]